MIKGMVKSDFRFTSMNKYQDKCVELDDKNIKYLTLCGPSVFEIWLVTQ